MAAMGRESKEIGEKGEDIAEKHLRSLHWEILERNFRSAHGELDIIARDRDVLVFVEVKNYSFRSYSPPAFSITRSKKQCIISCARYFLVKSGVEDTNCRFDVITIYRNMLGQKKLEHYKNAFMVN